MLTFVPAVREVLDRRAERVGRLDSDSLEGGESRALPRMIGKAAVLPKRFAVGAIVVALVFTVLAGISMTNLSTKFSVLDFVPTTSPLRGHGGDGRRAVRLPGDDVGPGRGRRRVRCSVELDAASPSSQPAQCPTSRPSTRRPVAFPTGQTLTGTIFQLVNPESETFDPRLLLAHASWAAATIGRCRPAPMQRRSTTRRSPTYPVPMAAVLSSSNGGYDAALFNFDTIGGEPGAGDLAIGLNAAFAPGIRSGSVFGSHVELHHQRPGDRYVAGLPGVVAAADPRCGVCCCWWPTSGSSLDGRCWVSSRRFPVAIVVVWVFGLMAAFSIAVRTGHGDHLSARHRHRDSVHDPRDASLPRGTDCATPVADDAIEHTLTYTGGALAGSAITTMAGFGILVTSTTIPFRQFGFVLAYTILLALIAAVLVLPSMLIIWDRWHRSRGEDPFDPDALHHALQDQDVAEGVPEHERRARRRAASRSRRTLRAAAGMPDDLDASALDPYAVPDPARRRRAGVVYVAAAVLTGVTIVAGLPSGMWLMVDWPRTDRCAITSWRDGTSRCGRDALSKRPTVPSASPSATLRRRRLHRMAGASDLERARVLRRRSADASEGSSESTPSMARSWSTTTRPCQTDDR